MNTPRDRSPRLRGRKAQARRLQVWAINPHCACCKRLTTHPDGFELDHIVPLFKGGADVESNLQVLCPTCHDDKTRRDVGIKPKVAASPDGWPVE